MVPEPVRRGGTESERASSAEAAEDNTGLLVYKFFVSLNACVCVNVYVLAQKKTSS